MISMLGLRSLDYFMVKRTCYKCEGRTGINVIKNERYGCWRCKTRNCRAKQGYLCGTFFEGTHLTTKEAQCGKANLMEEKGKFDHSVQT
uniref:Uncharacterized protein n=1 Tax=Meloidogyne enterolobii TaxID=390850 RepID=A0A6V7WL57_MELEN|nr:unnamed protein product [Meloidogyne enterolobii]